MSWVSDNAMGCILTLHAVPRAACSRIHGPHGDALKISLHAPPVDGRANKELILFLADSLGIHARNLSLVGGQTGRHKRVHIQGISATTIRSILETKLAASRNRNI